MKLALLFIVQFFKFHLISSASGPVLQGSGSEWTHCNEVDIETSDNMTLQKEFLKQYSWTSYGWNALRLKWLVSSYDPKNICTCVLHRALTNAARHPNNNLGYYANIKKTMRVEKSSMRISSKTFTKLKCSYEDTYRLVVRGYQKKSLLRNAYDFYIGMEANADGSGIIFVSRMIDVEPGLL